LSFDTRELLASNCLVTTDRDKYVFLFPVEYKPEYLVRDGTRYKMADEDIEATTRQVYLKFIVTKNNRFTSASLHDGTGDKFQHYHGDSVYDCWGNVRLPTQWDGRLRSLVRLVTTLMRSLATVNLNSILEHDPPSMPDTDGLEDRATELGKEGEIEVQDETAPAEGWTTGEARTGWGTRRRTGTTTTATEPTRTEAEEYMRRWGVATDGEARALTGEQANCALCGRPWGRHNGWECP